MFRWKCPYCGKEFENFLAYYWHVFEYCPYTNKLENTHKAYAHIEEVYGRAHRIYKLYLELPKK